MLGGVVHNGRKRKLAHRRRFANLNRFVNYDSFIGRALTRLDRSYHFHVSQQIGRRPTARSRASEKTEEEEKIFFFDDKAKKINSFFLFSLPFRRPS
jgi:hypothetical protein